MKLFQHYFSDVEHFWKIFSGTAGPIFTNFLCGSPVAMAQSFSGGVAICYVLPVLWMTSRLAIVGRMGCVTSSVAILSGV